MRSQSSPLRMIVLVVAGLALALPPIVFVAPHAAYAAPGDLAIDADIEDSETASFTFELRRTGGGVAPLVLDYTTVGAAPGPALHPATPGDDFTPIQGRTTFNPSPRDLVKRFTVVGRSDDLDEYDEFFALRFVDVSNPNDVYVAYGILDDTDPTPTYTLAGPATAVAEAAGSATVTATLSHPSGRDVSIPFRTSDGTASSANGEDYTATNATITVRPGLLAGAGTVPVTDDDNDDEDDETFDVSGTGAT